MSRSSRSLVSVLAVASAAAQSASPSSSSAATRSSTPAAALAVAGRFAAALSLGAGDGAAATSPLVVAAVDGAAEAAAGAPPGSASTSSITDEWTGQVWAWDGANFTTTGVPAGRRRAVDGSFAARFFTFVVAFDLTHAYGGALPPTPSDAFAALTAVAAAPGSAAYNASFGPLAAQWASATGGAVPAADVVIVVAAAPVGPLGDDGVGSERPAHVRDVWNRRFGGAVGGAAACALLALVAVVVVVLCRRPRHGDAPAEGAAAGAAGSAAARRPVAIGHAPRGMTFYRTRRASIPAAHPPSHPISARSDAPDAGEPEPAAA